MDIKGKDIHLKHGKFMISQSCKDTIVKNKSGGKKGLRHMVSKGGMHALGP